MNASRYKFFFPARAKREKLKRAFDRLVSVPIIVSEAVKPAPVVFSTGLANWREQSVVRAVLGRFNL